MSGRLDQMVTNWLVHVERMTEDNLTIIVRGSYVKGRRNRNRTCLRWLD